MNKGSCISTQSLPVRIISALDYITLVYNNLIEMPPANLYLDLGIYTELIRETEWISPVFDSQPLSQRKIWLIRPLLALGILNHVI